jgi:hypothetical protein
MITIFSTPRPFKGPFEAIQKNAIKSWLKVCPDCEIILFEDEEKTTSVVAEELGVKCITGVECDEFGTPLLNDVFRKVKDTTKSGIVVQINTDIILTDSFLRGIMQVLDIMKDEPFFMSGRRWDLDVNGEINFNESDWQDESMQLARDKGELHPLSGMDYWVLPLSPPFKIPPFVIGRPGMDSWLVYKSRSLKIPVIDATEVINIIHQNHNYPQKKKPFFEIERKINIKLAGGFINMMTLREANFLLTKNGLEKPKFPRSIFAGLALVYPWRVFLFIKREISYLKGKW